MSLNQFTGEEKMKRLNKYFSIYKTSFKQEKDSIVNYFFRAINFFIIIFIFVQLWSYIYGENGTNQIINNYSLQQMIWYLIFSEMIYFSARTSLITKDISNEIKSGNLSYKINKPYNFYLYEICNFMAKSCFALIFFIPVAILIGFIFVGSIPNFTWLQILPCIISILFSVLINWIIYASVGMISFWTQDATPFGWIVTKLFMLLGLFFPLDFFPTWLQPIIFYSPIYSIFSGPATLVADFSWDLFASIIISQISWSVIIIILGLMIYNLGKKKVVSNGG